MTQLSIFLFYASFYVVTSYVIEALKLLKLFIFDDGLSSAFYYSSYSSGLANIDFKTETPGWFEVDGLLTLCDVNDLTWVYGLGSSS